MPAPAGKLRAESEKGRGKAEICQAISRSLLLTSRSSKSGGRLWNRMALVLLVREFCSCVHYSRRVALVRAESFGELGIADCGMRIAESRQRAEGRGQERKVVDTRFISLIFGPPSGTIIRPSPLSESPELSQMRSGCTSRANRMRPLSRKRRIIGLIGFKRIVRICGRFTGGLHPWGGVFRC